MYTMCGDPLLVWFCSLGQYSAFLVTVSGCPGDTVMKLLLETDELVTGLSVRWSGNSRPSQSKGGVLVRFWGWALNLEPAFLSSVSCFPNRCASRGRFLASPS